MKCPFCKSVQVSCKDSREKEFYRSRRYECFDCGKRFTTNEVVVEEDLVASADSIKWVYISHGTAFVRRRLSNDRF